MAHFTNGSELVIRYDADDSSQYDRYEAYELRGDEYHYVCSVGCGYAIGWRELSADEASRLRLAVTARAGHPPAG